MYIYDPIDTLTACVFISPLPTNRIIFEPQNHKFLHQLITKMLPLLLLLFLSFSLAFGSTADVLYIEKLVADQGQLLDTKNFAGLANIFTPNATYNPGGDPTSNVYGIDNIKATLARIVGSTITHGAVTTESITLEPFFDEQGSANAAVGVIYIIFTYVGQGKLAGQALSIYAKYEDTYVKTGDRNLYGGWRISKRFFVPFVSFLR